MFGMNYTKTQTLGYAMIPVFIQSANYSNARYYLAVSKEKEDSFIIRNYKFEIKVIERYSNDTVKVRLIRSYVDNTNMRKLENEYVILKTEDINMKV